MKNIFTPIFLIALFLLFILHSFGVLNYEPVQIAAVTAAVLAVVLYGLKKFKPAYGLIAFAIGLLIAAQFVKEKDDFYRLTDSSIIDAAQGEYISLEGELSEFPGIETDHSILVIETRYLEFGREKFFIPFNIKIKVKGNLQGLYKGDIIAVDATIDKHNFSRNFYRDSMEDYLLACRIHFNGYCKSAHLVRVVEKAAPVWRIIGTWRNKIRKAIEEKYRKPRKSVIAPGVEDERTGLDREGVFLQAVIIGERGELGVEDKEKLLEAGIFHLLAISGANIGIIAMFSLGLLKVLKVSARKRYLLTVPVLIVFLVLSGFEISAERAVWMAVFIFIGRILFLDINIFNIISLCGLFMLARNPAEFLDAGFILTFTLTAAIVTGRRVFLPMFGKIFAAVFSEGEHNDNSTARRVIKSFSGGPGGRFFKKAPLAAGGQWIGEFFSANVSASLISLPLSLFYFRRYSFGGFFAGLVLIPLTAVITGLGVLLIPLAPVSSFLSQCLLFIIGILLDIFFGVVDFFSSSIDMTIFNASPSIFLVIPVLVFFFLLPFVRSVFQKIIFPGVILLILVFISVNLFFYSPGCLEVFFLDVGQGDCQVVVFPGGDALLIDGGGAYYSDFRVGERIVLSFLLQKRIRVKWAAVTHFHPDHAYGMAEMLPVLKPGELWLSSEASEDPGYQKLVRSIPSSTRVLKLNASFVRRINGCTVELLYPERFMEAYNSSNNHSQVIRISDRNHSFLFTGDIEKGIEGRLEGSYCSRLRSDVIKVPHHGSVSSSTRGFLRCVSPRFAVFSYAVNNRFRFPHREVVENYMERGTRFFSTARSGGIRFISLPGWLEIETSK